MNTPGVTFAADTVAYQLLLEKVTRLERIIRRNRRYGNGATVVAAVLLVAALAGWLR